MSDTSAGSSRDERIDIEYDYAVCAWARHFNTSQQRIKEAVQAVGDRAECVREHLKNSAAADRGDSHERPSGA